ELRGRLVTLGSIFFPIMLIVFGLVHWLPLSLITLVIVGISQIIYMNNSNSLVQTETPDHLRGRVLSIYTLAFFGLVPVGSLLVGAMAAAIGEVNTLVFSALILFGFAIWMRLKTPEIWQSV
ncbi:MAG: MFS transporter, partial [Anaerolineales bacterium]